MRFVVRALLIPVISAAALFLTAPSTVAALENCDVADLAVDSEEQALLDLINGYRSTSGAPTLEFLPSLNAAATWMSTDMGAKGYFANQDSLGRSPFKRMDDCDVPPSDRAQSLAFGSETPLQVFENMKAAPSPNKNMSSPQYHSVGIARVYGVANSYGPAGWYWTVNYSSVAVAANP